jgi:hypothetical protein
VTVGIISRHHKKILGVTKNHFSSSDIMHAAFLCISEIFKKPMRYIAPTAFHKDTKTDQRNVCRVTVGVSNQLCKNPPFWVACIGLF